MQVATTKIETGGGLIWPADPSKLPADRLSRWLFTAHAWKDMTDDQRARWREWFDWATAPGGELWDQNGGRAILRGARLDGVILNNARLVGAELSDASLRGADLAGSDLRGATMARAHLEGAGLQRVNLTGVNFADAHLSQADLTGADLSGAMLHDLDLTEVDFKDARLFATRITDPVWWVEMPRATLDGRTVFPTQLPEHPIQDVMGLPPLLRRHLADAQYLRDMYRKAGPWGRAMMWVWGVTCCYGQSFARWGLCTVALLIFFSIVFTFCPFHFSVAMVDNGGAVPRVHTPDFWQGMYFSISTMMTLGLGDVVPASGPGRIMVAMQEVFGYLMLGGLLSIFSNKLARLS